MGFRDAPLTSSSYVDTGESSSDAGVRVYNDTNPDTGNAQGFVEWRTGFPGDDPATITLRSYQYVYDPFPGEVEPQLITYGQALQISGGGSSGVSTPRLELAVMDEDQDGQWNRLARIDGADVHTDANPSDVYAVKFRAGLGINNYDGTFFEQLNTRLVGGDVVEIGGLIRNLSGVTRSNGFVFADVHPDHRPSGQTILHCRASVETQNSANAVAVAAARVDVYADGRLMLTETNWLHGGWIWFRTRYRLNHLFTPTSW